MPHLTGVFNPLTNATQGPISGHSSQFAIDFLRIPGSIPSGPAPGDIDTGSITGSIIDLLGDILRGRLPTKPTLPELPGGALPRLPNGHERSGPGFTLGGAIPTNGACLPNPCCRGQHLNKSRGCDGAPPGTKCVSNRRMNALNPRALRRATRRLKGFERAVKNTRKQLRTLSRI